MGNIATKHGNDVKKSLPYGAIKEVAKRSNASVYTVSRVINQGLQRPQVLKALAEYIEELAHTKQQLKQAVELSNLC